MSSAPDKKFPARSPPPSVSPRASTIRDDGRGDEAGTPGRGRGPRVARRVDRALLPAGLALLRDDDQRRPGRRTRPGHVRKGSAGAPDVPRPLGRDHMADRDRSSRMHRPAPRRPAPRPSPPADRRAASTQSRRRGSGPRAPAGLDQPARTQSPRAFVLTQLLGFSYEEAARICSCPVGTIRSRLARARTELLAGNEGAEDAARRRTGPTT